MANILVFGGSNVYGLWDSKGGWVERLRLFLEKEAVNQSGIEKTYVHYLVYNLGIPSTNTEALSARVQFEIKARTRSSEENIVIFDVGKNDSSVSNDEFNIKPSAFKKNLMDIVGLTKVFTDKIIFLSLLPVDESKTCPVYWNKNLVYKNEHAEKYNLIIKDVCDKSGAMLLDIYSIFKSRPKWQNLLENGLHLNQKGYRVVFETVKGFLVDNKVVKLS